MGFGLYSTPMDSVLFYIYFKGKERPPETKLFPANTARSPKILHMDPRFPGILDF